RPRGERQRYVGLLWPGENHGPLARIENAYPVSPSGRLVADANALHLRRQQRCPAQKTAHPFFQCHERIREGEHRVLPRALSLDAEAWLFRVFFGPLGRFYLEWIDM